MSTVGELVSELYMEGGADGADVLVVPEAVQGLSQEGGQRGTVARFLGVRAAREVGQAHQY